MNKNNVSLNFVSKLNFPIKGETKNHIISSCKYILLGPPFIDNVE